MKKIIAKYFLDIYLTFIKDEDYEIYKKWAVPFIKGTIFVSNIYIYTASILFFPVFILIMKIEKEYKKFEKDHQKILNIYRNQN